MPLYEYECDHCHRRTEKIQKFSDPELTVCPHCGGALQRTLTAPAIQFKGAGWYKDLYSSPKPAAAAGESGAASPTATAEGASAPSAGTTPAAAPSSGPAAPATPAAATSGKST